MTDRRPWALAESSTTDIAAIDKEHAVVVQPIGAVEQHGPHLPVMTDAVTAERITARAVASLPADANTWVLPTLSYGKSTEHLGWAGTVALSAETLRSVCLDVGRSVARSGFRKLVFVNGHGGQPELLQVVGRDIRVETGLQVFSLMPNDFPLPEGYVEHDGGFSVHGGQHETSMMLELAPELVDMSRAVRGGAEVLDSYRGMVHLGLYGTVSTSWVTDDLSANGVIGDPTAASAALGRSVVDAQVAALAATFVEIARFEFPFPRRVAG